MIMSFVQAASIPALLQRRPVRCLLFYIASIHQLRAFTSMALGREEEVNFDVLG
jgi:hypothetical protein